MSQQSQGAERVTTSIDKSAWAQGPWTAEPDRVNFVTTNGMDAAIIRARHSGALCGYVGVSVAHPWFGKDYSDSVIPSDEQLAAPVDTDKLSVISLFLAAMSGDNPSDGARIDCVMQVHGGLTYSNAGIADFGEDRSLWYFGFDCSHYRDLSPAMPSMFQDGEYRDIDYVRAEIESLALQLAAAISQPVECVQ